MGQRKDPRCMIAPIRHGFRHRHLPPHMPAMGMAAHQNLQLHRAQCLHHLPVPRRRTDRGRRQVGLLRVVARKAEGHRHHRHAGEVIERVRPDPQPVAQPVARGIGERPARGMDPRAGRLPRHQHPRTGPEPDHGPRCMGRCCRREAVGTDPAGPDPGGKLYSVGRLHGQDAPLPAHPYCRTRANEKPLARADPDRLPRFPKSLTSH